MGYQAHLTVLREPESPHLVIHVETTGASGADRALTQFIQPQSPPIVALEFSILGPVATASRLIEIEGIGKDKPRLS